MIFCEEAFEMKIVIRVYFFFVFSSGIHCILLASSSMS